MHIDNVVKAARESFCEHDGLYAEYGKGGNKMCRTTAEAFGNRAHLDDVDFDKIERTESVAKVKAMLVIIGLILFAIMAVKL
ncbi:hypothetical protein UFOVP138_31 [uncultured Caudovirales phage]|uniref:Uncharacterized protein n=1 Tax=uncultured Caudovirales phage TaxID=2100421 RepID=A0A6J5LEP3_9CAUD|nr:hypothetical protein UFOVP138_31 [uncultured Caudovirales phage]